MLYPSPSVLMSCYFLVLSHCFPSWFYSSFPVKEALSLAKPGSFSCWHWKALVTRDYRGNGLPQGYEPQEGMAGCGAFTM